MTFFPAIPSFLGQMLAATIARRSTLAVGAQSLRAASTWSNVPAGPPDPILGTVLLTHYFPSPPLRIFHMSTASRCYRSIQSRQGPSQNQLGRRCLQRWKWQALHLTQCEEGAQIVKILELLVTPLQRPRRSSSPQSLTRNTCPLLASQSSPRTLLSLPMVPKAM